ncbi:MAG: hypothetical protein JXA33_19900 [Anaerolineae bacterium]|nr:hypothetical protein [Anaerolineae bacterium]
MDLHIVGGFLGSGKTTAIIGALKLLLAEGKRVGVVTNDKGRHLVDTAFFARATIPTTEVPGGCFRCNYGDFQERIAQLQDSARPDVIFAESVGSCVDLVGPVIQPLAALPGTGISKTTYSVFADSRLLRRRMLGLPMPYSDAICYIFDKQLEEASLIILNKIDLLSEVQIQETLSLAKTVFPDKVLLPQNSLIPKGTEAWVKLLAQSTITGIPLDVDYDQYGAGAAQLAWLDQTLTFTVDNGQGCSVVQRLIAGLVNILREEAAPIAHLKFFVQGEGEEVKLSFDSLTSSNEWQAALPSLTANTLTLIINARIQMAAERLRTLVGQVISETLTQAGIRYEETERSAFAPQVPKPT